MKKQLVSVLIILSFVAAAGVTVRAEEGKSGAATTAPAAVDVKNTKCIVAKDDVGDSKLTVTYQGKLYHLCCADCKGKFEAEPEKYVKALEKDPGSYGITKN